MVSLLFCLFITIFSIQTLVWFYLYGSWIFSSQTVFNSSESPFVSIIVVFKNESENLKKLIPILLDQSYANYEIILMNDFSSDDSKTIVSSFDSSRILAYDVSANTKGKKGALKEGISKASGKYILLTDADCRPYKNWVSSLLTCVSENTDLVLGYAPMSAKHSFVSRFSSYETWHTALNYFSFAKAKIPYMGVGRNMLLKRSSIDLKSLYSNSTSISGDDDILVQALANSSNTRICNDPDSFVFSEPKSNIVSFLSQKNRHLSSSWEYKWYHKMMLFLIGASIALLYPLFGFLIAINFYPICLLIMMSLLMISKWILAIKGMKKLGETRLIILFPILDLFMSIYHWILLILMFKRPNRW